MITQRETNNRAQGGIKFSLDLTFPPFSYRISKLFLSISLSLSLFQLDTHTVISF